MNKFILGVGLLASTPAFAFPITLNGQMCEVSTGICGAATATLQSGGRGSMTIDVLGTAMTTPMRWRADPAAGTVDFLLGTYPLRGTLSGGCGSGVDTIATPPILVPILGATMTVDWELCR